MAKNLRGTPRGLENHQYILLEDFGPASKWKDPEVAALASQLQGTDLSTLNVNDKYELWNLMADNDVNSAFSHPKVFAEYALSAKKNKDEDSPTYMEALTGPYEEEF